MNNISYNGQSHDFETVDELLKTPLVAPFRSNPEFKKWGVSGKWLLACDTRPVWHVIGLLKEPVVLPATIQGSAP